MKIGSNVITAVVTALSVVALTWNPSADAAAPESTSISVCVNKKSGVMRNATKCARSERKITVAQANVSLTEPTPVDAADVSNSRQIRSAPVGTELSIGELAGQSVQTLVRRVTVPNNYGRDLFPGFEVSFPDCPTTAPISVSRAGYSPNYTQMVSNTEFLNSDGSTAGFLSLTGNSPHALFSDYDPEEDPEDWARMGNYPKDGDMDLYLLSVCAPILVVQ